MLKIGSKVIVNRQIGKDGIPTPTIGTIERFSQIVLVKGKPTAVVRFKGTKEKYWFPIDEIEFLS